MSAFSKGFTQGLGDLKFNSAGLGEALGQNIGAIASAVGGLAGGLIGDGYQDGIGNIMGQAGQLASVIPGPLGAALSGGMQIFGGLTNRAVGTKVNQEALNQALQGINYLNSFKSTASSFDDINLPQVPSDIGEVYKGGFLTNKAKRRNKELRRRRQEALDYAYRAVDNNIENLDSEQMDNMLANYAAFGGPLHTHGADWTNGITIIGNGGSHESNPFEGVPMGIAPDGQPNLVEEGEVIFNDYVFSNRLRVPKAVREKYKLRGPKDMTFAYVAKKAQKESEERPNDPISQRGLEDIMYKLMPEQEAIRESRQQRKYSEGGRIHIAPSKKGTFTAAASKHGMGVQEFASKVLANPEDYSPAMRKKANFARNASKWKHAYGGHLFWKGGFREDNPFNLPILQAPTIAPYTDWSDPVSRAKAIAKVNSLKIEAPDMTLGQPSFIGQRLLQTPKLQMPANTATTENTEKDTFPESPLDPRKIRDGLALSNLRYGLALSNLRYAPAFGGFMGAFSDLMGWTNKPDYSNADTISNAANSVGDITPSLIGDYMTYTPLDKLFYADQLGAQAGATRRAILNTSGGNRGTAMAGLLAADYNAQGQLGNLFRQAEEYNLAQREKVAAFNRGTNMFNSEQGLKAAIANRERDKARIDALVKAAAIRDAVDTRVGAARSANLTNLFNSLGDIGREAFTMNMVMSNPALYYSIDRGTGKITYKNGFDELSEGEKAQVRRAAERASKKQQTRGRAYGGYLTIRRRRR